jgi:hypothetical protein
MGKIFSVAVAIVFLTASWVGAGNFDPMADAGVVRAPTPLHIKAGTPVKAEFRSNLKTSSDTEIDTDNLLPERVSAKAEPSLTTRPAVAFRERATGTMAPPPEAKPTPPAQDFLAESMEEDLEKDLVLSPPPPKVEEAQKPAPPAKEQVTTTRPAPREEKKAAAPPVKPRKEAAEKRSYVLSQKPIQKVRPLTSSNPWQYPAGTYGDRRVVPNADRMATQPCDEYGRTYCPMTPSYMTSEPRRRVTHPPTTHRFIQDGVTVKLAPASAALGSPPPYQYEQGQSDDDVLSAITEILGLPFAFVSSFF